MGGWRSILLHLDAAERSGARLTLARELARHHGARLTALYAVMPAMLEVPFDFAGAGAGALPVLAQLDAERRDAARARFDQACSGTAATPLWRELEGQPLIPAVVQHGLCADLMVLGQRDADEPYAAALPADFVAAVVVASGRPALVVPARGDFDARCSRVLIGWKPTREAAHAVSGALPLLARATAIHIVADTAGNGVAGGAALEAWLRLHRIEAPIERHGPVSGDAGAGLLQRAAEVAADVLVMGCYGHSRAREFVLGGASRTVLRDMALPVLLAH